MKKTPLYNMHQKYGAKIVDFFGWALPVQYEGIIKEHNGVRTKAGVFDVSHMGEIIINGLDAEKLIQKLITNDIQGKETGQITYSPMCYENAGTVDDILIYKKDKYDFLLVVNAANVEKDYNWIVSQEDGLDVSIENESGDIAQLALQGPASEKILSKIVKEDLSKLKFYRFIDNIDIDGTKCLISRTGYTGEDGFEIYVSNEHAEKIWEAIFEAGEEYGIIPAGLGARDSLRLEASLPLYGHEFNEEINPFEAGFSKFIKTNKDCFIGKDKLLEKEQKGTRRILVGFEMTDRGIPREGYIVKDSIGEIGKVTSGGYCPFVNKNLGMALVANKNYKEGDIINIEIRNKKLQASVVKMPFYKKKYQK